MWNIFLYLKNLIFKSSTYTDKKKNENEATDIAKKKKIIWNFFFKLVLKFLFKVSVLTLCYYVPEIQAVLLANDYILTNFEKILDFFYPTYWMYAQHTIFLDTIKYVTQNMYG